MTDRLTEPPPAPPLGPGADGPAPGLADPLAGLPPAPADNPLWEDAPHREGDPPLRRVPPELRPGAPAGVAARRLGRQLRAWREARGATQRQLAERLGMAQPNLARLEGGAVAPTLTTLALLAERLGVRVTITPGGAAPEVRLEDAPAGGAPGEAGGRSGEGSRDR
jgi:DNA-binding XRE family transcriptional regulator